MTDPVWQIKSPGVLWLPPTGMEIALALDPHFGKVRGYQVIHNGKPLPGRWSETLEYAKMSAKQVMRELLEMGIEP